MARSLRSAAALSIGAALLAAAGMGGTAYAGSTGIVHVTISGCVGTLNLSGGGSSNLATASVQSTGPNTCWLSFYQRRTADPAHPVYQSVSVGAYSSATIASAYYHDSAHQVAIAVSNGSTQQGSDWYS
ncbi:hypothetical protein [Streptomyces sp. NPDC001492]